MQQRGWRFGIKRAIDVAAASSGLVLFTPVIAVTALSIRLTLGSPVFFRQQRPGLNARPFALLKFRTMRNDRSADGELLSDAERLTSLGKVVRSLSLDELPQLVNVLRGDMTLVGPRPLLLKYLPRYNERQARRHEVLPGVTGWAQVNGRNALTHEEKFELDVWYVENWSLALDAKIIWLTFKTLWRRSGISAPNHATMSEFMGQDGTSSRSPAH